MIGGMAAIGPLLGGWLTTNLSWRWAFFLNLPVGLLAVIGTLVYIGESRDEDSRLGFDLPGFMLITVGLGGVVFGLIEGRTYGWLAPDASHPFAVLAGHGRRVALHRRHRDRRGVVALLFASSRSGGSVQEGSSCSTSPCGSFRRSAMATSRARS